MAQSETECAFSLFCAISTTEAHFAATEVADLRTDQARSNRDAPIDASNTDDDANISGNSAAAIATGRAQAGAEVAAPEGRVIFLKWQAIRPHTHDNYQGSNAHFQYQLRATRLSLSLRRRNRLRDGAVLQRVASSRASGDARRMDNGLSHAPVAQSTAATNPPSVRGGASKVGGSFRRNWTMLVWESDDLHTASCGREGGAAALTEPASELRVLVAACQARHSVSSIGLVWEPTADNISTKPESLGAFSPVVWDGWRCKTRKGAGRTPGSPPGTTQHPRATSWGVSFAVAAGRHV